MRVYPPSRAAFPARADTRYPHKQETRACQKPYLETCAAALSRHSIGARCNNKINVRGGGKRVWVINIIDDRADAWATRVVVLDCLVEELGSSSTGVRVQES